MGARTPRLRAAQATKGGVHMEITHLRVVIAVCAGLAMSASGRLQRMKAAREPVATGSIDLMHSEAE